MRLPEVEVPWLPDAAAARRERAQAFEALWATLPRWATGPSRSAQPASAQSRLARRLRARRLARRRWIERLFRSAVPAEDGEARTAARAPERTGPRQRAAWVAALGGKGQGGASGADGPGLGGAIEAPWAARPLLPASGPWSSGGPGVASADRWEIEVLGPLELGVNNMKGSASVEGLYTDPAEGQQFGTAEQVLDDLALLGVRVVRALEAHDLVWGILAGEPGRLGGLVLTGEPSDCPDPPLPADMAVLAGVYATEQNVGIVARLIAEAHARGLRLRFRFFGKGGGTAAGTTSYRHVEPADSSWGARSFEVGAPVGVCWAPEHGVARGSLPADVLDPWNEYDRAYACHMAWHTAGLVVAAWRQSGVGGALTDVVEGVALLNELQGRNVIRQSTRDPDTDPSAFLSGAVWGQFLYETGLALHLGFLHALKDTGLEPPGVYLPGLASYGAASEGGAGLSTWPKGLVWLQGLLLEARSLFASRRLPPGLDFAALTGSADDAGWLATLPGLTELDDLFAGIDCHVYHCHGTGDFPADPRPVLSLVWEVRCLRELFDACGMPAARITTFESGVRGGDARGAEGQYLLSGPFPDGSRPDFLPRGYTPGADADHQRFQAHEVWRRLGGALLAGAEVLGWHTLMSEGDSGGAFELFGLRRDQRTAEDVADDQANPVRKEELARPSHASPRQSWSAYYRFVQLLTRSFGTPQRLRLLLPDVDLGSLDCPACFVDQALGTESGTWTSADLGPCAIAAALGTDALDALITPAWAAYLAARTGGRAVAMVAEDLLVLEVEFDGVPKAWGYLVFIDPWRNTPAVCVAWSAEGGLGLELHATTSEEVVEPQAEGGFPLPSLVFAPPQPVPGTGQDVVRLEEAPRFYTCAARVAWTIADCAEGAASAGFGIPEGSGTEWEGGGGPWAGGVGPVGDP